MAGFVVTLVLCGIFFSQQPVVADETTDSGTRKHPLRGEHGLLFDNYDETIEPITYKVPDLDVILYVESNGRRISAMDSQGKVLWSFDPYEKSAWKPYRMAKPVVRGLGRGEYWEDFLRRNRQFVDDPGPFVSISYSSSQFGVLNVKTGKMFFLGRD